jgi:hypothetical protein
MEEVTAQDHGGDITTSTPYLIAEIHTDVKHLLKAHEKYDERLRAVEKKQWYAWGGAAVFCALTKSSVIAAALGLHLG